MDKLKQIDGCPGEDYFAMGVDDFENGDFKRAMEFFQAAIEQNPYLEQAYLKLAEVYFSLNDERNAKKTLYRLLSINPDNSHAQRLLRPSPKGSNLCVDKVETVNSEITSTKSKAPLTAVIAKAGSLSDTRLDINKTYLIDLPDGNKIYLDVFTSYRDKNKRYFGKIVRYYQRPQGDLSIPSSVLIKGNHITITQISSHAFSFCDKLISVEIPPTVTIIGDYAFPDSALQKVTFLGEWPPKIELFTFGGHQTIIQFFVPEPYIQNYQKYLPRYTLIPF